MRPFRGLVAAWPCILSLTTDNELGQKAKVKMFRVRFKDVRLSE